MFQFLKRWTMNALSGGSSPLGNQPPPKAPRKQQSLPSYATSAKMPQQPLPKSDKALATTDPLTFRTGASTSQVLRDFAQASPELSSAIFSYLRVGISSGYKAVAYNLDGSANPDATSLLYAIIKRIDVLPDYTQGFNGVASLQSLSESLAKELLFEGAMCGELVLDKTLLPSRIQPLSVSSMSMVPDKDNYLVPMQILAGQRILLDAPTIFYIALDQSLITAYPTSPLEASIRAVLFSEQFVNDIQRVIQRAIHPRLDVSIDEEKFRKNIPQEIEHDEEKLTDYQNQFIAELQQLVNNLEPQDALVHFDSIGLELVNNGNASLSNEYDFIQKLAQAKLASGSKTMPAVLGLGSDTQNVASTQSMLFVKAAAGAIRAKLNEFYSRLFTLAVRLMGQDVTVAFEYDDIDLRPASELESFKAVKQSRILEQLSLGLITDEEACLALTGHLPPKGMAPLSGTMFMSNSASTDPGNDGSSNGAPRSTRRKTPAAPG
jgi:hypothetical protein